MSVSLSTVTMAKNPRVLRAGPEFLRNFLNRHSPVETVKLNNGFRVATQTGGANGFATVGVHSKSGSRFDTEKTAGVSALMQRAMLQGTTTKSAAQVQAALAELGGDIQFHTDREHQSISINCLGADSAKAAAFLADVTRNAKFDDASVDAVRAQCIDNLKEFENDVPAVVQQNLFMNAYESTKFEEVVGSALYNNPLGNGVALKAATGEQVKQFHSNVFDNANTVALVATGDVNPAAIQEAAEAGFGSMAAKTAAPTNKRYTGGCTRQDCGVPQEPFLQHVSLGWEVCGANSADVVPLQLLTQVFGKYDRFMGDFTQSDARRHIYERATTQEGINGYENIHPFFETFSDTGLMGFYQTYRLGDQHNEGYNNLRVAQNDWVLYCMRLQEYQVETGKNLLKSKILFENDGAETTNKTIGQQLISAGGVTPIEQAYARIEDVTTTQVSDTINHYYYDREPLLSAFGVMWTLPTFYHARRNMYKWRF